MRLTCEARKDKGIAEGIIGVTAVAVGVVAIIGTAGMATPIVVTAGVAGSSAIVYGASNLSEGVQDGYYGSHGNLSIATVNPVRDFIFAGNQGLYDAWGNLSMTVAGLCIPIGQAVNGVAGAGRDILAKTAIKTIAKETVKDKIYDGISTGITNFATEKFNLSQSGAVLLNAGLSFGLERGVEFSGKKLGIISEHSFAQDMSFDDAARYNKFMDESMHGIHNNHPGLNNMDIKAWNLADTKLKEHLSIEKVDVNEILDLRMREMEMENYFLNRPKKGSDIGNRTCLSGAEHFEALKEMFGEENVEWISRDTLSGSDRIRIQNWGDNAPIEDMYIKYKNVYQNDLYYNQSTGEVRWPNNDGFDEAPRNIILQPGDRVDRYGSDYGTFLSPVGVPYEQRSLAPGTELKPYSVFEVMKPIEVKSGKIATWFNQPGGGIQYIVPDIIDELIDKGFLRRINE